VNTFLNENISCIIQDSKKNIWIGGSNGITYISGKDTVFITTENGLISNKVSAITEDFNGNILIGTKDKGIVRFLKGSIDSDNRFKFEVIPSLSNSNFITSITKDKNKNIWISTTDNGIYLLKDELSASKKPKIALTSNEVDFFLPVRPKERVKVVSEKIYFRFNKLKCKVQLFNEKEELVCRGTISGMLKPVYNET